MPDPNAGLPPRYLGTPEAARFLSLSGRTNSTTSGKTTHTPRLEALRLDNPSLQKASRHE